MGWHQEQIAFPIILEILLRLRELIEYILVEPTVCALVLRVVLIFCWILKCPSQSTPNRATTAKNALKRPLLPLNGVRGKSDGFSRFHFPRFGSRRRIRALREIKVAHHFVLNEIV